MSWSSIFDDQFDDQYDDQINNKIDGQSNSRNDESAELNQPELNQQGHQRYQRDLRDPQRGRVPESLINAAIDGELSDEMQREIAHALNYDQSRKQDLLDTAEAINALQMPISTPDFSEGVLKKTDRHRRFLPATWRKRVRASRMVLGVAAILALAGVATIQHINPRLTTLAAHPTPIQDFEQAVEQDADRIVQVIADEAQHIRASIIPFDMLDEFPGVTDHRYTIEINTDAHSNQRSHIQHQVSPYANYSLAHARFPSRVNQPAVFISTASFTPHQITGVRLHHIVQSDHADTKVIECRGVVEIDLEQLP